MNRRDSNSAVAAGLLVTCLFWGGNNVGTKWLVQSFPPVLIGQTRFLFAGLIMITLLRWTTWFGTAVAVPPAVRRKLWLRTGLALAAYVAVMNWALRLTSASHVALYLATSPVWALLWEERPKTWRQSLPQYGAAVLALGGVVTLFWPVLRSGHASLTGELLGILTSLIWTVYNHECRKLGKDLPGVEIAAQTMWRTGVWLLPWVAAELLLPGPALPWSFTAVAVQAGCLLLGGVVAYAFWNNALRAWPISRVMLFNNLIPVSTMTWAHFCLGEPVTRTFWFAILLIASGVALGQADFRKHDECQVPPE